MAGPLGNIGPDPNANQAGIKAAGERYGIVANRTSKDLKPTDETPDLLFVDKGIRQSQRDQASKSQESLSATLEKLTTTGETGEEAELQIGGLGQKARDNKLAKSDSEVVSEAQSHSSSYNEEADGIAFAPQGGRPQHPTEPELLASQLKARFHSGNPVYIEKLGKNNLEQVYSQESPKASGALTDVRRPLLKVAKEVSPITDISENSFSRPIFVEKQDLWNPFSVKLSDSQAALLSMSA